MLELWACLKDLVSARLHRAGCQFSGGEVVEEGARWIVETCVKAGLFASVGGSVRR